MLKQINNMRQTHEEGFTLTEIIIVIVIIGILAAIAVPLFINNRKQAADAQLLTDVKNTATKLEATIGEGDINPTVVSPIISNPRNVISASGLPQGGFCIQGINYQGTNYTFDSNNGGFVDSKECIFEGINFEVSPPKE